MCILRRFTIFTADQISLRWRIEGLVSVVCVGGGKRPLESPTREWEDNIKKNLKELECEVVDWIYYGL